MNLRKITTSVLTLLALAIFARAVPASAESQESIQSYDIKISAASSGTLNITEKIVYDFGSNSKHGIFRDIPVHYSTTAGTSKSIKLGHISVTDQNNKSYPYTTSHKGSELEIKIGDPNKTVSGLNTYVINYSVDRAIIFSKTGDEIYWNAIGQDWQVPIKTSTADLTLPATLDASQVQVNCYVGPSGSTNPCDLKNAGNGKTISNIQFAQFSELPSGSGMTFVVTVPKKVFKEPTTGQKILQFFDDNWPLGLPILALLAALYMWFTGLRGPRVSGIIVAEYEAPDRLSPTEIGTIVHDRTTNKDVSADIIYLATKGYLDISRVEKKNFIGHSTDYTLHRLKDSGSLENTHERTLLDSLFATGDSVNLSDLKNKFYKDLASIKKQAYALTVSKGYLRKSIPKRAVIMIIAGAVFIALAIWGSGLFGTTGTITFIGFFLSGLILILFGAFANKRTLKGQEANRKIKGFKEYLSIAEKDRIKFANAPEKNPKRFEQLLPFAIVLGVEKQWAKQFEGIYSQPPSWFHDPTYSGAFNSYVFVNSLSNFTSSANQSLAVAPGGGGGGGGSSGGGFGGGGGGSW